MLLKEKYTPIYFLSALGAGGLAVSFFMYLMFVIPHAGFPLPTFDILYKVILEGTWLSIVAIVAMGFVAFLAFLHIKLLIWNIKQYSAYKETEAYKALKTTNAEVSLMALPLTFAMSINVLFVTGVVFVPGIWGVVEYLFPFALLGFMVVGYFAIKIFMSYFSRILHAGNHDGSKNNNLSQMISIFAFVMIGVGFAAPGAMSHNIVVNAIGIMGAIFFTAISIPLLIVKFILGLKDILEHGITKETSPSLWITIPILTLIGITLIRISFGMHHGFNDPLPRSSLFILTTTIVSLQIMFGILGYKVMKEIGYFDEFLHGESKSPISFSLICPGVSLFVFGMFFINFGLTANEIIDKYSIAYFVLMAPLVYIQFITVRYLFKLKRKFAL